MLPELILPRGLTPDQEAFLAVRPTFSTDILACESLGLASQLVYAWRRKSPEFRLAYNNEAQDMLQMSRERAAYLVDTAVSTVEDIFAFKADPAQRGSDVKEKTLKLRAAEIVFKANGMMDNITIQNNQIVQYTADDLIKGYLKAKNESDA